MRLKCFDPCCTIGLLLHTHEPIGLSVSALSTFLCLSELLLNLSVDVREPHFCVSMCSVQRFIFNDSRAKLQ